MEEMQLAPEWFGSGLFGEFFSFVCPLLPDTVTSAEAWAHPRNLHSTAILAHLGLRREGDSSERTLHFKGKIDPIKKRYLPKEAP